MMDWKEFASGALSKALNIAPEKFASLSDEAGNPKEDAEEQLLAWRSEQVQAEKASEKKRIADLRDSYMRQGAERFEKRVSEGLGIDFGKATGDDAVEVMKQHIEAMSAKGAAVDPKDEQAVKNSPIFQRAMREAAETHNKIVKDYEAKLTGKDAEFQRRETLRTVKDDIKAAIKELNAVLPDDPKLLEKQMRLVDMDLENVQFEGEGDERILKDKEGNVIETPQGHAVKYRDFLKDIVRSNYPIAASTTKTTAGDITKGSKPSGGSSVLKKPANADDLAVQLHKIRTDSTLDRVERHKLSTELEKLFQEG